MEPWLGNNDKQMFYKYLDNALGYFEYGSGGSTYQAAMRDNIKVIYSVESDKEWHEKLKTTLKNYKKINFIYNEMDVKPNNWGHPGPNSTPEQQIQYSEHIKILDDKIIKKIDLVFIDGRFRAACCLKCFDVIKDNCLIAFDDFLNRPQYHIVLQFYDIVEKTTDNRMVILKKKSDISISKELIQKYELIKD
jgi:protein O-GlcNAc transferase